MPTKGPGRKSGRADRPKTKRAQQARADAAHARKDEAHARKDEAHAREDEAHARKDEARAEADEAQAKAGGKAKPDYTEGIAQSIFRLSEMLGKDRGPDGSSLTTDAVTQALLLVLGSAPAVAKPSRASVRPSNSCAASSTTSAPAGTPAAKPTISRRR